MAQVCLARTTGDPPGAPEYQAETWQGGRDREASPETLSAPDVSGRLIAMMCSVRKDRQQLFPGALGSDNCWDILLQLYRSHVEQHRLYVGGLTERTGLPGTTVLRSLERLCSAGLVDRSDDHLDRRRVLVELSSAGIAAMNRFFVNSGIRAVLL